MTDIIINGTTVRVGQVWEDNEGFVSRVKKLSTGCAYPIEMDDSETYTAKGWYDMNCQANPEFTHLVRCIHDPNAEPAVKAGRKVVQIINAANEIAALCDDGTLWICSHSGWSKLPPIPQEDEG